MSNPIIDDPLNECFINEDKCPDCGSPMIEVCSGLEKLSKESCGTQIDILLTAIKEIHKIAPNEAIESICENILVKFEGEKNER